MRKAAKISLISLAIAVPAAGIGTAIGLMFSLKNKGQSVVVTEQDKKLVDDMNEAIDEYTEQHGDFETMSDVLDFLATKGYYLQYQELETKNVQFVWDYEADQIILLKNDNTLAYSSISGYQLNEHKYELWKMVKPKSSMVNLNVLASATNSSNATIEQFNSSSEYSQFLRDGFAENTELTFCAGLDTGNNKKLKLTFNRNEDVNDPIIINTSVSSLTIKGEADAALYGNLSDLLITYDDEYSIVYEHGSIDAAVVLDYGHISAEKGSDINQIIISNEEAASDVGIILAEGCAVGSIGATTDDMVAELSGIVQKTGTPAVEPEIKQQTVTEPTEDPNKFYTGDGTKKSPWCIKTWDQLKLFASKVSGQTTADTWYFNLVDDITVPDGETWTPVGTKNIPFKGIFNGCGFAINNLTIAQTSNGQRMGMFAYTSGDVNTQYKVTTTTSGSTVSAWDDENNEIKLDLVKEDLYTTSIKNLYFNKFTSVSEKTETVTDPRYVAALIGDAANTYISNVHVNSGTIKCGKGAAGIAGTLQGCIVTDCTTGTFDATGENQLTITATEYNAAGIAGGCAYGTAVANASCDAFINCTNHANISGLNTSSTGGFSGGIVGYSYKANASYGANLFQDCLNTGEIYAKTGSASGIGMAGRAWVFNRCSNTGFIHCSDDEKSTTTKPRYSLAGITLYGMAKCVDCSNSGKISGYAEYMAGIFGESSSGGLDNIGLENCINTGELISSNSNCIVANIATGERTVVITGGTYATVADLNNELSGKISSISAITVELVGVTVTDKTGTLSFPSAISSFVSDNPVASSMDFIGKNGTVVIDVPNMNVNVSGDCSQTTIMNYSDNSTLTIAQGAICNNAVVVGTDSKIINNGTISGSMSIDGYATYGENGETGICSSVTFGYIKFRIGHGAKHLVNKGVIKTTASESNQHVLYSMGGSDCSITIDNYNTIEYYADAEFTGALGYLFLLNNTNSINNVINCYAGSKLVTSCSNDHRFSLATNTDLYYQSGAEFKAGGQTIEWSTLTASKLSVHEME